MREFCGISLFKGDILLATENGHKSGADFPYKIAFRSFATTERSLMDDSARPA